MAALDRLLNDLDNRGDCLKNPKILQDGVC